MQRNKIYCLKGRHGGKTKSLRIVRSKHGKNYKENKTLFYKVLKEARNGKIEQVDSIKNK